ncbi:MAG: acetylxylan esterase, partial [Planctomycetota bacterium]|nr:acetylxylan esterase [Planctomycetota bacterium]
MKKFIAFLLITCCSVSLFAKAPRVFPEGQRPDDARLKPLKDLNGFFPFEVPKSLEAWEKRAAELRLRILVATGLYPLPPKTPLNAVIHGKFERPGFTVEKVYFESYPGLYVTGLLFRPT